VAVGDFNEDGFPDLAVANGGGGGTADVSLFLGDGDSTFAPAASFATGTTGWPQYLVVADLNGDGFDDVAVTTFADDRGGHDVSVLLGTGTGTLGPASNYGSGFGPSSVAVGDFNEDGIPDLVVTNLLGNSLSVLLGTGGGNFAPATTFRNFGNPNHVVVGDFNEDGFDDLAVALLLNGVSVYLGTGTGTFGAATNYPAGTRSWSVAVGDLNGDGFADLAVANDTSDDVSVLLGTGTGIFGLPTNFPAGDSPLSVAVGDFNDDGKPDLAAANNQSRDVSILINTTGGDQPPPPTTTTSTPATTTTSAPPTTTTTTLATTTTSAPATTTTSTPPSGGPIQIDDLVLSNGDVARVTGTITCKQGGRIRIGVDVTQDETEGRGIASGTCTGEPQRFRAIVDVRSGPGFEDGTAQARAVAQIGNPATGRIMDRFSTTEEVEIEI
jgi:hypothetical protein